MSRRPMGGRNAALPLDVRPAHSTRTGAWLALPSEQEVYMSLTMILVIVLVIALLGGGGYYWRRW